MKNVSRYLVGAIFIAAGLNHFRAPEFYRRIVPPVFPSPGGIVAVSGFFEILGGAGLLIPRLRKPAAVGLIALLVAVFPANFYMAMSNDPAVTMGLPGWVRWARLPLQIPLIWWVWSVGFGRAER